MQQWPGSSSGSSSNDTGSRRQEVVRVLLEADGSSGSGTVALSLFSDEDREDLALALQRVQVFFGALQLGELSPAERLQLIPTLLNEWTAVHTRRHAQEATRWVWVWVWVWGEALHLHGMHLPSRQLW